jgi:hypothetical protein
MFRHQNVCVVTLNAMYLLLNVSTPPPVFWPPSFIFSFSYIHPFLWSVSLPYNGHCLQNGSVHFQLLCSMYGVVCIRWIRYYIIKVKVQICLCILVWRIHAVCSVFLLMLWNLFSVGSESTCVLMGWGLMCMRFLCQRCCCSCVFHWSVVCNVLFLCVFFILVVWSQIWIFVVIRCVL